MSGFTIDPQRGPHIRDYSDQSQERVIIYSNTGYWAANGCGYTTREKAGVYTRDDAYKRTGHCGPEKGCCFYDVPADHVPTLKAEVKRLRSTLEELKSEYEKQGMDDNERKVTYLWSLSRINFALAATEPKGEQGCQSKS